ncbi:MULTISPECIES: S-layer homology domain-containing protein [unclassified Coleofasciculus]|uniref:S-layer homology domain-containing protein n=1 Tax=unclassified Coleofasciculus TaxID=2692782 RepID=UPI001880E504|nr:MULTISPECIES: S-layer homology domain-containing protein [unclassified Coleofasciculus]MBE9125400.1 S-layer homology domain-containing protein [Coleofasciculus sp. LEGE 07081]MBE9147383.1 S-layer homology domain-containing protein [Coleofasciculus sp. LEGE 07092]
MRYWGRIFISSILGSTMLWAATVVANLQGSARAETNSQTDQGGSLGSSLLNNMLGADALRPQNPTTGTTQPPTGTAAQLAQARSFPDIQGNWAQPFIEALTQRNIIAGFPDGTFRPNQPVTRAQFAAMIRQAFEQSLQRQGTQFVDIPRNYWAFDAIQEAYRMGFLEGYPNNIFLPEQNIPRLQVLVALASGLDLSAPAQATAVLNQYFQDAAQIPDWARNSVAAATVNQLVVNYPNVAFLNPNQIATRADVAAFIYQALVNEGVLPQLSPTSVASRYIVGYEPPIAQPPTPPQDLTALRQQYLLPTPPVEERLRRIVRGNSSIMTPTAFGAQTGDFFVGASYQESTRLSNKDDGGVVLGFGLGDAERLVALETAVSIYDLFGDTFEDGGVSFKVHRLLPGDLAVAVGVENLINWGEPDAVSSVYGVVSKIFQLQEERSAPFSRVTASVGLGGGRFRSADDIENEEGSTNVFGSIGVQVIEPVTVIAEWSGQDLNVGASIVPIKGVPLIITPAAADITGEAGDGVRFILGIGYAISF